MSTDHDKPTDGDRPPKPEKSDLAATLDDAAQAARKRGRPQTAELLERLKPKESR